MEVKIKELSIKMQEVEVKMGKVDVERVEKMIIEKVI
jgi:hypothetical protein